MAYKQPSSGLPFKELGSSPAKQYAKRTPKNVRATVDVDISDEMLKQNLKTGKKKVDLIQHTTGVSKNPTGKKIEKRRTDYLKSLDKK